MFVLDYGKEADNEEGPECLILNLAFDPWVVEEDIEVCLNEVERGGRR